MSTPTATMPAPKGNSLEIVYQTLGMQTEQAEALKQVIQEVINTKQEVIEAKQEMIEISQKLTNVLIILKILSLCEIANVLNCNGL